MKTGSLVKIGPDISCLGLRMDDKMPFLLKEENLMVLLSFDAVKGFCKVLLLGQEKPVVLLVTESVLELAEEVDST